MIGATPRSGTTILQQVLAAHPAVVSPPETHFFIEVETAGELLAVTIDPTTIYERFQKHSHLHVFTEMLTAKDFQAVRDNSDSRETFFKNLMDQLARKAEASVWVEKTPHHLRRFPMLLKKLPEVKTLIIVRDPRDVCASLLNIRFASDNVEELAHRWLSENVFARQCLKKYAGRMKLVIYKKLVYETESTVRELCDFAGIEFHKGQLQPEKVADDLVLLEGEHWRERNFRPITDESIGRYKEDLTAEEIKLIERITAPLANNLLGTEFETTSAYENQATEIARNFKQALGET